MRMDLELIQHWIPAGSRVLDLGCGDGTLLSLLNEKGVETLGLEIDEDKLQKCAEKGINVIEQDLDKGLPNFRDKSFDTVVMTQTLQAVHYPHKALDETLRVGQQGIVAFPNFAHWRCRGYLSLKGHMPVSKFMPYTWYDTPNIHFCTIYDFEDLCKSRNIKILDRIIVDENGDESWLSELWPNLFGLTAIYRLSK